MKKVRRVALAVVIALVASSIFRLYLYQTFLVPSSSMEPTLQIGERIAVSKFAAIQRGDIIVFRDPGDWLPGEAPTPTPLKAALSKVGILPPATGQDLVKRVVGVGGDRVVCCNAEGELTVNRIAVDESSYVDPSGGTDRIDFDVTVPEDKFLVMGDNRDNSKDSRFHFRADNVAEIDESSLIDGTTGSLEVADDAFVSSEDVVGKAVAVIWPVKDARRVTRSSEPLHRLEDEE